MLHGAIYTCLITCIYKLSKLACYGGAWGPQSMNKIKTSDFKCQFGMLPLSEVIWSLFIGGIIHVYLYVFLSWTHRHLSLDQNCHFMSCW